MLWTTRSKQVRLSLRTAGQLALAGGALGELPRVEHAFFFMREWCVAEGALLPVDSLRQVLEALCACGHVAECSQGRQPLPMYARTKLMYVCAY